MTQQAIQCVQQQVSTAGGTNSNRGTKAHDTCGKRQECWGCFSPSSETRKQVINLELSDGRCLYRLAVKDSNDSVHLQLGLPEAESRGGSKVKVPNCCTRRLQQANF
eukprot:740918-Amphidinium_carterae.1